MAPTLFQALFFVCQISAYESCGQHPSGERLIPEPTYVANYLSENMADCVDVATYLARQINDRMFENRAAVAWRCVPLPGS